MAEITAMRESVNALRDIVESHDKILVRGNGQPSLQEMYRNLARTVEEYITEQRRKEAKAQEEWNRLKWLLIGAGVPIALAFIGQALVFYIRVLPVLELLAQ